MKHRAQIDSLKLLTTESTSGKRVPFREYNSALTLVRDESALDATLFMAEIKKCKFDKGGWGGSDSNGRNNKNIFFSLFFFFPQSFPENPVPNFQWMSFFSSARSFFGRDLI